MYKEKIAVLTDSGSDVSQDVSEDLFVLPLLIQIENKTYIDGEDIDLNGVLLKLDEHKITTSLPSPETIYKTLDHIKSLGYTHLIINTISSGLSGTFNVIRMIVEDYDGLTIGLIDTKNISKGSGYTTYKALELIEQKKPFAEIMKILSSTLDEAKVFFTIETVEYLRRGGRIGLVAGTIASILNIKPIISCNEHGVYYTVKKTKGYEKAIQLVIEAALDFIKAAKAYDLTVLVAKIDERIQNAIEYVKNLFDRVRKFEIKAVTPALAIHIGPNSFGLVLCKL